jgi:hypothetical protein
MSPPAADPVGEAFVARPLTPARGADLEELFGLPGGSVGRGRWCMAYRRSGRAFSAFAEFRADNKRAMDELAGVQHRLPAAALGGHAPGTAPGRRPAQG